MYPGAVVIYSTTWLEYLERAAAILHSFRVAGLTVSLTLGWVGYAETKYLRNILGNGQVKSLAINMKALLEPHFETGSKIPPGISRYYQHFVPHFFITVPLTNFLHKNMFRKVF